MGRLDSLDWLRGLLAFSIMIYHLTSWEISPLESSHLLGRLGIYGVSMFFVLSGLSMAVAYSKYHCNIACALNFFIRRIYRIWPLLWLAIIFVTIGKLALNKEVDFVELLLNFTTLFGFVSPGSYINTGAWSIGNEMVYYALTPFLLYIFDKRVLYGNILLVASIFLGGVFALELISSINTLANQWNTYINPFNNLFFYIAGIAIYFNIYKWKFGNEMVLAVLFAGLAIFLFYPSEGGEIQLITGGNRITFSIASILLVIGFYKLNVRIPALMTTPLTQLGIITYGVYLLHPIIYQSIKILSNKLNLPNSSITTISLTIVITIVLSLMAYQFVEKPLIEVGKKVANNLFKLTIKMQGKN